MTIAAVPSVVNYTATGATTVFAVPYVFFDQTDLVVTLAGITKTLGVDYTVLDQNVVFSSAPTGAIVITRNTPLNQLSDFTNQGAFLAESLERAIDHAVALIQQVKDGVLTAANVVQSGDASASTVVAEGGNTARAFANVIGGFVDPRNHGAVGNGIADDTAAIQAAIDKNSGGRIQLSWSSSYYRVTSRLSVPSNTSVEGFGRVRIKVPAAYSATLFDVDGKTNITISGIEASKESGAAMTGAAFGVHVRGNATNVCIERCNFSSFVQGVQIAGQAGTVPGTASQISLVRVRADGSPTLQGFNVDDASTVIFDDCHASGHWLDGFKLRKNAFDVTIRNCSSYGNGVGGAGDGLDSYAGGDRVTIDGFTVYSNTGNGLTVKTGELNQDDNANFGYVRRTTISGIRAHSNTGFGLYLTVSDQLDKAQPLASEIVVQGGIFEANSVGIYVNARNVSLVSPVVKGNSTDGIQVAQRALDVVITSPLIIANGTATPGTYSGIAIGTARRVQVLGGSIIGATSDRVAVETTTAWAPTTAYTFSTTAPSVVKNGADTYQCITSGTSAGSGGPTGTGSDITDGTVHWKYIAPVDYASLTPVQLYAIRVSAGADEILIDNVTTKWHAAVDNQAIRSDMTTGTCVINHRGSVNATSGVYGGVGSTWLNTAAAAPEDVLWVKTSGAPNASTTGWQRPRETSSTQTITTTTSLTASSPRTVLLDSAIGVDRAVNLPSTLVHDGMEFDIVRSANATGAFNLNVVAPGPVTLKALTVGTYATVRYSGTAWFLKRYGTL